MVFTGPKPVFFASGVFENSEYAQLSGIFIEKTGLLYSRFLQQKQQ
jgi:hypothetical protein